MRYLMAIAAAALCLSAPAHAQKKYGPGASDSEVKVGNFMPYSGPASAYGILGKIEAAYVKMLNDNGGINGRRINFISYDNAYSPTKSVEQTRKLVESDEVLFLFQTNGTPSNSAILKYVNQKKVPHIMLGTGGTNFGDNPTAFPWTMPFNAPYQAEGRIYAKYILQNFPNAKIGVLFQNDDYGRDIYKGLRDGLGDKASLIISEAPFDVADSTVDSQIVKLRAAGADLFVNFASPKFAAMALRKLGELGWKPVHILCNVSSSVAAVIRPAGFDNAQDVISAHYIKDPTDPAWKDDPALKEWEAFLQKYAPDADRSNSAVLYAYGAAQVLEHILRKAGDDLTRENIMKQATSLKGFAPASLLPGITMNTSSTDYFPVKQMQMMRFKGERWELFGSVIDGTITK